MHSGSVNAAMLLSSFLGNEHEKIGHGIAQSDFAGELGKLFPQKAGTSDTAADGKQDAKSTDMKTSIDATQSTGVVSENKSAAAETVGSCLKKSASQGPDARLENLKNRAKSSEKVYITNPVLIESILSELEYPAETIKACKNIQNQDGWISLKGLKDLLSSQTVSANLGQGQISTAQAQALLASIVQRAESSGAGTGRTFEALKDGLVSVNQLETAGFCNVDQFRAMLDQVLQQANTADVRKKAESNSSGTETREASGSQTAEIAMQSTIAPRQGQTESLVSNILPSFLSEDSEESGQRKKEAGANSQTVADATSQALNLTPDSPALDKAVPVAETIAAASGAIAQQVAASKSDQSTAVSFVGAALENPGQSLAADPSGQVPGESTKTATEPPSAVLPETVKGAGLSGTEQNLASLAEEFGATIVSMGADKETSRTMEAAPQNDSRSAAAVQGQNFSALAKEVVKTTGERISVAEQEALPLSEAAQGLDRIITQQSEDSQEQPFPDYDPNRSAGLAKGYRDQTRTSTNAAEFTGTLQAAKSANPAKSGETVPGSATPDNLAAQGTGTSGGKDIGAATASILNTLSSGDEGASGTSSGEGGSPGRAWPRAEFTGTLQAAKSANPAKSGETVPGSATPDNLPAQGTGTSGGKDIGAATASILNTLSSGDEGASGAPSGEGPPTSQAWPGTGGNSTEQAPVGQIGARITEDGTSIQGHELAGLAKDVEKQLKLRDAAPDAALLQQGTSHRVPGSRMEVPLAQQSPGSGLNYNPPGGMAEVIENFREQYRAGGQHLVLELDPEKFGKMSIKVGARKDEVSAVVVTESESARQALLRNAPDLRQSLDDQGLSLGKFRVDVDHDRAGGGNANPDRQKPEGQTANTPAERAGNPAAQTRQRPVYIRNNDGLSQLSLFA